MGSADTAGTGHVVSADPTLSTAPRRLLVVGELNVDLVVELDPHVPAGEVRFGQHEQLVPSTTITLGSSSAITACGAAALGVPTTIVGVRGDDVFGRVVDDELRTRGVDTSAVRVNAALPTGASTHLTVAGGDRAILTAMGSIGTVRPDDVGDALLDGAMHLHVGSWFLQESLWAHGAALYARARRHGLSTSVDGNFDPAETWASGIHALLPHLDVLFGNEQELCGITGADTLDSAVESVLDRMPAGSVVVAKLGAGGAYAAWREASDDGAGDPGTRRIHAAPPQLEAPLVDTVGAGDTLAAGFLAARLAGAPLHRALALAVACGSASTRGAGGVGAQPDLATATRLSDSVAVTRLESVAATV